jgi:hypothetical protein
MRVTVALGIPGCVGRLDVFEDEYDVIRVRLVEVVQGGQPQAGGE